MADLDLVPCKLKYEEAIVCESQSVPIVGQTLVVDTRDFHAVRYPEIIQGVISETNVGN